MSLSPPAPSTAFISPEHLSMALVPVGKRAAGAAAAQRPFQESSSCVLVLGL